MTYLTSFRGFNNAVHLIFKDIVIRYEVLNKFHLNELPRSRAARYRGHTRENGYPESK
jgi:hypothetical protein